MFVLNFRLLSYTFFGSDVRYLQGLCRKDRWTQGSMSKLKTKILPLIQMRTASGKQNELFHIDGLRDSGGMLFEKNFRSYIGFLRDPQVLF